MKHFRLLLFAALCGSAAFGQNPACLWSGTLSAAGNSSNIDNRGGSPMGQGLLNAPPCTTLVFAYSTSGTATLQMYLDSAADNSGSPGTFAPIQFFTVTGPGLITFPIPASVAPTIWFRVRIASIDAGTVTWNLTGNQARPTNQYSFNQEPGNLWNIQSSYPGYYCQGYGAFVPKYCDIPNTLPTAVSSIPVIIAIGNGTYTLYMDTGVTPGSSYTPTARFTCSIASCASGGGGAGIDRIWLTQGNGAVAGSALSLPASNAPTPNVNQGTNVLETGYLTFPNSSATSGFGELPITANVPSSLTLEIMWRTTDTNTGHVVTWNWNYACTGTSIDPVLSSAGTLSANALSVSNQTQLSTITLASPSCTAGQNLYFQLRRRGDTDTITAGVDVTSVRLHN